VAFSPDSHLVTNGSSAGLSYIWDLSVDPPSECQLSKHMSWVCFLAFLNSSSLDAHASQKTRRVLDMDGSVWYEGDDIHPSTDSSRIIQLVACDTV